MHKLGIIVPYRNRSTHLREFKKLIVNYLEKTDILYEIIIIKQDDAKLFNRGALLNIGFKHAKILKCDYVVFHDVDMIPFDVDYSYSDKPIHLATNFINNREIFDSYFGGVTLFPVDIFEKINGYSNKYWGWGYEDDDLLLRCKVNGIKLDKLEIINNVNNKCDSNHTLKLNGNNAYIHFNNFFNFKNDYTLFITFNPDNIICNHEIDSDEYKIFSIPGYDFSIFYSSFNRYSFCAFDDEKNALYVNSNIKTNYKTCLSIVVNSKEKIFMVYQDGELVGKTEKSDNLYKYEKEKLSYIGVGNPYRKNNENYFKGNFYSFSVYDTILPNDVIYKVSNNYNISGYEKNLKLSYDSNIVRGYKLVDLSGGDNDGVIVNCEILKDDIEKVKTIDIPYRRKSMFDELSHDNNGFENNTWKNKETRWNQLRFINEVSTNNDLLYNDGLSNLIYAIHGTKKTQKITELNVGI